MIKVMITWVSIIKVITKRMSTTARVIRVWWNVDFISGLRRGIN